LDPATWAVLKDPRNTAAMTSANVHFTVLALAIAELGFGMKIDQDAQSITLHLTLPPTKL
jgi:hypothetical protein